MSSDPFPLCHECNGSQQMPRMITGIRGRPVVCGAPFHDTIVGVQPGLFDPPPRTLVRLEDPETSHAAARTLSGKAGTMRRRLLETFAQGDYTAEEAASMAGYRAADGAWKRVSDLANAGLIEWGGDTRQASSGRRQRVLVITPLGLEALG